MSTQFINAEIILPGSSVSHAKSLTTNGDKISEIGGETDSKDSTIIDCKGKILAPGIVDFGVFAIDKPAFHFGGITRTALMPGQRRPLDLPAMIKLNATEGKPDLWSHPVAAATKGLAGKELAEIGLMKKAGAMAVATGRSWISDSGIML